MVFWPEYILELELYSVTEQLHVDYLICKGMCIDFDRILREFVNFHFEFIFQLSSSRFLIKEVGGLLGGAFFCFLEDV